MNRRAARSVEQLFQKGFAALVLVVAVALMRRRVDLLLGWRRLDRRVDGGSFNDLVQLSAVEPDTAAGRAVIDFDTLPFGHGQRAFAGRAKHDSDPLSAQGEPVNQSFCAKLEPFET